MGDVYNRRMGESPESAFTKASSAPRPRCPQSACILQFCMILGMPCIERVAHMAVWIVLPIISTPSSSFMRSCSTHMSTAPGTVPCLQGLCSQGLTALTCSLIAASTCLKVNVFDAASWRMLSSRTMWLKGQSPVDPSSAPRTPGVSQYSSTAICSTAMKSIAVSRSSPVFLSGPNVSSPNLARGPESMWQPSGTDVPASIPNLFGKLAICHDWSRPNSPGMGARNDHAQSGSMSSLNLQCVRDPKWNDNPGSQIVATMPCT
mmetsp:Transcript_11644/g.25966  ORF Transcript_11644/g.25966 Transcript_11644/m.25966 type:complete len:262 (+) Transcript_11644:195-980(+)